MKFEQKAPIIPAASTIEPDSFNDTEPLPVYYTLSAIMVFTILFGATFGSIMMAINFHHKPRDRGGVFEVILFGILFSIAANLISKMIGFPIIITWTLFSIIAAFTLKYAFWGKCIEKDMPYKKKSLLWPILIGTAFFIFYFSWGIYKGLHPEQQSGI